FLPYASVTSVRSPCHSERSPVSFRAPSLGTTASPRVSPRRTHADQPDRRLGLLERAVEQVDQLVDLGLGRRQRRRDGREPGGGPQQQTALARGRLNERPERDLVAETVPRRAVLDELDAEQHPLAAHVAD